MNKQKFLNIVGVILLVLATMFLFGGMKSSAPSVGGVFHPVMEDFAQGISQNGTTVLSSAGALTVTSLTNSGSTAITGSLTALRPVTISTADTTVTKAQSGTIFETTTAGVDWTLPAVATSAGAHYRFAISGAFATTNVTVVSAEGDNIEGSLIVAGAVVDCDANDVVTFVNDGENIGDFVDLYSDGTSWIIGSSGGLTSAKMTCSG